MPASYDHLMKARKRLVEPAGTTRVLHAYTAFLLSKLLNGFPPLGQFVPYCSMRFLYDSPEIANYEPSAIGPAEPPTAEIAPLVRKSIGRPKVFYYFRFSLTGRAICFGKCQLALFCRALNAAKNILPKSPALVKP